MRANRMHQKGINPLCLNDVNERDADIGIRPMRPGIPGIFPHGKAVCILRHENDPAVAFQSLGES